MRKARGCRLGIGIIRIVENHDLQRHLRSIAGGGKTVFKGLPLGFHAARWWLRAQHQMIEIAKPVFCDAALRFQREPIALALPLRD
ncbi:hypothetical protein D3C72_2161300 [compost metagenome]